MAVNVSQVSVGTTAVQLVAAEASQEQAVVVTVCSPTAFMIGGSGVTATTGFAVPVNVPVSFRLQADDLLYGIAAVTAVVSVLIDLV